MRATVGLACDYYTDVAAMAEGPPKDGLFFLAAPVTRGFNAIRERARCVNVQLILDDGTVGLGDCLSVIRSGSHDRHLPLAPDEAIEALCTTVEPLLVGRTWPASVGSRISWTVSACIPVLHTE